MKKNHMSQKFCDKEVFRSLKCEELIKNALEALRIPLRVEIMVQKYSQLQVVVVAF